MTSKKYIKKFGNSKENITFNIATWDGKYPIKIITPKHPTKKIRNDTINFLMEMDDHDGLDIYYKKSSMNKLKINDVLKEIQIFVEDTTWKNINTKTKKIKGCKESWFKKGERLAKEYIVIRSGYNAGPYKSRAIGFNSETNSIHYAT